MNDSKKRKPTIQAELDKLGPPSWLTEMRRHFAQHGTFRPEDIARLHGSGSHSRRVERAAVPTAALLQQMVRASKK